MKIQNTFFVLALMLAQSFVSAQDKYVDKNGQVTFEASEKLFEEVKATNSSVTAIFDSGTLEIASLALVKGFTFKNSLMEEHFNENYIESETYPKATFKGNLKDLDVSSLSEETTKVPVAGTLELHGKGKQVNTELDVKRVGDIIEMTGNFVVAPADFDIEIPKIVANKIAKQVQVALHFKFQKR
ncbi:MAG: YceI family protein [Bacteroidota bacterium]